MNLVTPSTAVCRVGIVGGSDHIDVREGIKKFYIFIDTC